jgi:imidazolonepropionase-like amidohydrolase
MWATTTPQVVLPKRRVGELRDGFDANFIVLAGNPLADFANTSKVQLRVKDGKPLVLP